MDPHPLTRLFRATPRWLNGRLRDWGSIRRILTALRGNRPPRRVFLDDSLEPRAQQRRADSPVPTIPWPSWPAAGPPSRDTGRSEFPHRPPARPVADAPPPDVDVSWPPDPLAHWDKPMPIRSRRAARRTRRVALPLVAAATLLGATLMVHRLDLAPELLTLGRSPAGQLVVIIPPDTAPDALASLRGVRVLDAEPRLGWVLVDASAAGAHRLARAPGVRGVESITTWTIDDPSPIGPPEPTADPDPIEAPDVFPKPDSAFVPGAVQPDAEVIPDPPTSRQGWIGRLKERPRTGPKKALIDVCPWRRLPRGTGNDVHPAAAVRAEAIGPDQIHARVDDLADAPRDDLAFAADR